MEIIKGLNLLTGIVFDPSGKGCAEIISPQGARYIGFEAIFHQGDNRFKIQEDTRRPGSRGESLVVAAPRYLVESHLSGLLGKS